jgi:hypothetical protein
MADFYKGTIPIIGDEPDAVSLAFPNRTGWGSEGVGFGAVPRDYSIDPPEMFQHPSEMVLIPESEDDARFDEEEATKSSLEHLYLQGGNTPAFPLLDQNGHGYCWAYSTGHAIMIERMKQGAPLVRLNPHSVAAIIKGGRDEGGWCGLSAKFAREHGFGEEGTGPGQWPLHSRSLSHDTPALRAAMALRKVQEDWVDLTKQVYDQNLTRAMSKTCLQNKTPCPMDFSWWGHSVCAIRYVRIERGRWGWLILNSWKGWGRHGLGVIEGSRMNTMGALGIRVSKAA